MAVDCVRLRHLLRGRKVAILNQTDDVSVGVEKGRHLDPAAHLCNRVDYKAQLLRPAGFIRTLYSSGSAAADPLDTAALLNKAAAARWGQRALPKN